MFHGPVFGDSRAIGTHGRRTAPRARLNIPGRIILRRGVVECLVEDLSRTGARLMLRDMPALGETGILEINRIEGFGAAVWIKGARCGFHFDEPLALQQVVDLRQFADHFTEHRREQERTAAREFVQGRRFV
ncbi:MULTISPECIES: PilZ domain-containing protein [unclassified Novosphingobium]|uniref:PilZ domain-containing protein n=1 Tax=Novosphingobium TaxID=165696 RepID=UPI0014483CAA|nr:MULTISPECIES: PilZ domain-containing protein [unclassified Novosphingobium]NKJ40975.1 hypothetical protein [Novosphingobium sp. SG720]NMN03221.1 hypothetical protein [Novosphingobium sp. SG919]NMN86789.1 hypothetical protein [Novosphingobium sp. SG916]